MPEIEQSHNLALMITEIATKMQVLERKNHKMQQNQSLLAMATHELVTTHQTDNRIHYRTL